MDKHRQLVEIKLFWFALVVPLVLGCLLSVFIFMAEDALYWCSTSACVQRFFEIYKFPIAISGIALPLVAMVAAIHRSKETALQIDHGQRQYQEAVLNNRFGNYLKHREGFERLLSGFIDRENKDFNRSLTASLTKLYSDIYPVNGFNNPEWFGDYDIATMRELKSHHDIIVDELKKSSGNFNFIRMITALALMTRRLHMGYSHRKYVNFAGAYGFPLNTTIAGNLKPHYAIIVAAFDAIEMYLHIAAYAGINEVDHLSSNGTEEMVENVKASNKLYELTTPINLLEEPV